MTNWIQVVDTTWYSDDQTSFELSTAEQLAGRGGLRLIENCTVIGNGGSYITGHDGGGYIGGISGYRGVEDGKTNSKDIKMLNCKVQNITVTGGTRTGGIAGNANNGNTVKDCEAIDVTVYVTDPTTKTGGLIVGANNGSAGQITYVVNNKVSGTTQGLQATAVSMWNSLSSLVGSKTMRLRRFAGRRVWDIACRARRQSPDAHAHGGRGPGRWHGGLQRRGPIERHDRLHQVEVDGQVGSDNFQAPWGGGIRFVQVCSRGASSTI